MSLEALESLEFIPCPWCAVTWPSIIMENEGNRDFRVICTNGHKCHWCRTPEEAVIAWNTREYDRPREQT